MEKLSVKDWKKFQHFKDRRPPWIKLYRDILDDRDWFELNGETAKVLVMIWLIASEYDGELPPIKDLSFRLRMKEKDVEQHVIALSHWLVQSDIEAISAQHQDDAPETERETEKRQSDIPDQSDITTQIWKAYPGNRHRRDELQIPRLDAEAILNALAQDGDKVLAGVMAYQRATDFWTKSEKRYVPKIMRFMQDREYLRDPDEWRSKESSTDSRTTEKVVPVNPADIIKKQALEDGGLGHEEAVRQARERAKKAREAEALTQ